MSSLQVALAFGLFAAAMFRAGVFVFGRPVAWEAAAEAVLADPDGALWLMALAVEAAAAGRPADRHPRPSSAPGRPPAGAGSGWSCGRAGWAARPPTRPVKHPDRASKHQRATASTCKHLHLQLQSHCNCNCSGGLHQVNFTALERDEFYGMRQSKFHVGGLR